MRGQPPELSAIFLQSRQFDSRPYGSTAKTQRREAGVPPPAPVPARPIAGWIVAHGAALRLRG